MVRTQPRGTLCSDRYPPHLEAGLEAGARSAPGECEPTAINHTPHTSCLRSRSSQAPQIPRPPPHQTANGRHSRSHRRRRRRRGASPPDTARGAAASEPGRRGISRQPPHSEYRDNFHTLNLPPHERERCAESRKRERSLEAPRYHSACGIYITHQNSNPPIETQIRTSRLSVPRARGSSFASGPAYTCLRRIGQPRGAYGHFGRSRAGQGWGRDTRLGPRLERAAHGSTRQPFMSWAC